MSSVKEAEITEIDPQKLDAFLGRAVNDMGAAMSGLLVVMGDRLGLYKAMAGAGPMTPAALAKRTGTGERQVREWLNAQATCGYVTYDAHIPDLHAAGGAGILLRERGQPRLPAGVLRARDGLLQERVEDHGGLSGGKGMGWHEHHPDLFAGTFRFFRPGYNANLVSSWIPAMDGSTRS